MALWRRELQNNLIPNPMAISPSHLGNRAQHLLEDSVAGTVSLEYSDSESQSRNELSELCDCSEMRHVTKLSRGDWSSENSASSSFKKSELTQRPYIEVTDLSEHFSAP